MGNHPNKTMYVDVNQKAAYAKLLGTGNIISKRVDETEDQALMKRYLRETREVTPYTRETYPHSITVRFNGENTHA